MIKKICMVLSTLTLLFSAQSLAMEKTSSCKKQKFITNDHDEENQVFEFSWKALCHFSDNSETVRSMLYDLQIDSEDKIDNTQLPLNISNDCLMFLSCLFENENDPEKAHIFFNEFDLFKKMVVLDDFDWLLMSNDVLTNNFRLRSKGTKKIEKQKPLPCTLSLKALGHFKESSSFGIQKIIADDKVQKPQIFKFSLKALDEFKVRSEFFAKKLHSFEEQKGTDSDTPFSLPVSNECLEFLHCFFEDDRIQASVYFKSLDPEKKCDLLHYFIMLELDHFFLLSDR